MIKDILKTIKSTKLNILALMLMFCLANVSTHATAFDADFYGSNDIMFYDETSSISCSSGMSGVVGEVPDVVPDPWRSLINQTAPKYPNVDPRLVAATLFAENRGWPEFKSSGWAQSGASAAGPWQFIPSTWATMGTDGDGDGRKDPDNPKDSVHAAFKHQLNSNGKPLMQGATGDIEADYKNIPFKRSISGSDANLLGFLANYNGSGAPNGVTLSNFPKNENSNYVKLTYRLIATNFEKWWSPETNKIEDATKAGALFGGSGSSGGSSDSGSSSGASAGGCAGQSGSVNADGYSFPLLTDKDKIINGYKWPCESICHHDNSPAFDLSISQDDKNAGIAVGAIIDGTVEKINNSYAGVSGCQTIQLKGSDGYYYWYGHIQRLSLKNGDPVKAGEQIAEIGRRACTGNGSYPHLHIDRGYPKGKMGGSVGSRDKDFVPLINKLYEELGSGGEEK